MKIVQVVNSMIAKQEKITSVVFSNSEYFFLFDGKYKWSIKHEGTTDNYVLFFYPNANFVMTIQELAGIVDWDHFDAYAVFKTSELKTREAKESFSELYLIVTSKALGLDEAFDDIINS